MTTAVLWFRRDLRLIDNPALIAAARGCERVVPVYIHAPEELGRWGEGSASRWWLDHSLRSLGDSLRNIGSRLIVRQGGSLNELRKIAEEAAASSIFWNRLYDPAAMARDAEIKQTLREDGLQVESFNSALLHEPWSAIRSDNSPYKIFTPYWKALQRMGLEFAVYPRPSAIPPLPEGLTGLTVDELALLPKIPWDGGLRQAWRPGEKGAHARLERFLDDGLSAYPSRRDIPSVIGTSQLSPHLHFGEIGPRQLLAALQAINEHRSSNPNYDEGSTHGASTEAFIRELAWREFAYHLLFHFPHTPESPLDERFERFPWADPDGATLHAWQRGQTGIPLVDAGMRELWHTGWMHNRVRMVVASFLVKNLRIHWLEGARWFWDTLVDADLANNTLGWQWTAGCGADAAPYFRVFNPVLQGIKFDPNGEYIRRWVPELAALSCPAVHQPWNAEPAVLLAAGVRLGDTYPHPIVDLKASRNTALAAFARLKESDPH